MPTSPVGLGAKTGNPKAPSTKYSANAAKPRRLPSVSPTNSTPKFPSVRGTGVPGRKSVTREHNATNKLAATTIAASPAQSRARSFAVSICVVLLAISVTLQISRCKVKNSSGRLLSIGLAVRSMSMLLGGVRGFHVTAHSQVNRDAGPQYGPTAAGQNQEPP